MWLTWAEMSGETSAMCDSRMLFLEQLIIPPLGYSPCFLDSVGNPLHLAWSCPAVVQQHLALFVYQGKRNNLFTLLDTRRAISIQNFLRVLQIYTLIQFRHFSTDLLESMIFPHNKKNNFFQWEWKCISVIYTIMQMPSQGNKNDTYSYSVLKSP